ncbi:MAG: RNA 2',3'-cyclic phosphodiesterase [Candidatus Micrarchaeota archaeon]|nr:RNA 2',3'-cyclic phosphodiesterase [Candidatus Micrarchaeota archaeon]
MRAFIAVDLPENIKDNLWKVVSGITAGGVTRVKKEAMHITLVFLGSLNDDEVAGVKAAMDSIRSSEFEVGIDGVSYFSPKQLRVVFAAVGQGAEKLIDIYKQLSASLSSNGIDYSGEREYRPHVTLLRVKDQRTAATIRAAMYRNNDIKFGKFTVRSIALKESMLTGEGPRYRTLYVLKL